MKKYIIVAGVLTSLFACRKEHIPVYSGPAGIVFYSTNSADSLIYSFAYQPLGTNEDTIFLNMRVLGPAKDFDREIKVVPAEGTNAREGTDFKLPEIFLPAGALTVQFPIVIYNTPEMLTQTYSLIVKIVDSKDLIVGATGREGAIGGETGGTVAMNKFKLLISNKLEKPSYWREVEYAFGVYSEAKFRFMITTLGITDFSFDSIGNYGYYNYPLTLANALIEYEAENGPLIDDETGQRVTFP